MSGARDWTKVSLRSSRGVAGGWYRPGLPTGALLLGYAIVRFALEVTRQPDVRLELVLGSFSMGRILSAIMAVAGVTVLAIVVRHDAGAPTAVK